MKKTLLLFAAFLTLTLVNAQTFTVGDLVYNVTTAPFVEVSGYASGSTAANLTVPSVVEDPDNLGTEYTVVSIGNEAFRDNTIISEINLPETVVTIGSSAFRSSTLTKCNFDYITFINGYGFYGSSLAGDIVLTACEELNAYVFTGCTGITSFEAPAMITFNAGGCSGMENVRELDIPVAVDKFGGNSLKGNTSLEQMQLAWTNPAAISIAGTTLGGVDLTNVKLYVPVGTKADYVAHAVWTLFPDDNIIEGEMPPLVTLSTDDVVAQELGFSIYPNPTSDFVFIKNTQLTSNAELTVFDLNGRLLLSREVNNVVSEINISNLTAGIYLLKIKVGNGEFTKRILKQ
ncbi:leucine-rich repeat domain-containing protein [Formosa undariae]|uniref:Leucine-rich repeat domain-containing protein n=1 Tax=Formosa undariae TaxID=1325436 RepID=A0ABV5F5X1_9FLAO